jgi:hypothetical protein
MKTKTFFLTTLVFVFLLTCFAGIHTQTAKANLDPFKEFWVSPAAIQKSYAKEQDKYAMSIILNKLL